MHNFFLENFREPGTWFEKRLTYTRATAANSMAGHLIGLGDRHSQNILVDRKSAEVRTVPVAPAMSWSFARQVCRGGDSARRSCNVLVIRMPSLQRCVPNLQYLGHLHAKSAEVHPVRITPGVSWSTAHLHRLAQMTHRF